MRSGAKPDRLPCAAPVRTSTADRRPDPDAVIDLHRERILPDAISLSILPWALVVALLGLLALTFQRRRARLNRILDEVQRAARNSSQFERNELLALTELSADWLWKADRNHRLVVLSEGFDSATRIRAKRMLGLTPWDLGWQTIPEDGWDNYRSAVAHQQAVQVRLRFADGGGHVHWIELSGRPMFDGDVCTGYLGIGRDITRQMLAEHALNESRALYQDVINSVREVVFRTDDQKRLTLLNRAWEVITRHPIVSSIGRPLADFLHPDDRDKATRGLDGVLVGEQREYHASLRLYKRTGEICWIELSTRRVSGDEVSPDLRSLVGTIDDISSRKIAEMTLRNINQELEARVRARTAELEISNRELEAFSYSVSHDLRAPLRSIDGFARLIEEDLGERLDAGTRDHLERIRNAASRMSYLSDRLIELARFTRHALKKESVNLSEMATQVFEELRAHDPQRRVEIEVTADLMAIADKTLMRVVLDNLLGNAWKFTAKREIAHIRFSAEIEDDQRVFCVADDGAGFDMAFAANLFRPFYRLHDEASFKGSGIGLANVQRIIERHGGRIWADSIPDQGARFHFTLSAQ